MSLIEPSLRKINEEMMRKVLLMVCVLTLVNAGVIRTDYSPSVSYSSLSTPIQVKTISAGPTAYTKIIQSPPVYQSVLTTKESNYQSPDGFQHATFSKSFDTAYSSLKNIGSKTTKDGEVIANSIPNIYSTAVHSPVVYHAPTAYTLSSPLVHTVHSPVLTKSVSIPVTYSSHAVPLSKTIVSPSLASYSTPVYHKTNVYTSGFSPFSTGTAIHEGHPVKTTLTYSEAPLVSHMSFTGLGASYAW